MTNLRTTYQIVSAGDDTSLEDKVNTLLKAGWKLKGGVAIVEGMEFYQAMILTDASE